MRFFHSSRVALSALILSLFVLDVSAVRVFESSSLATCQDSSNITASLFDITFTPDNQTLVVNLVGEAYITGNVTFKVQAAAYGYTFLEETLNPCTEGLSAFCPLAELAIGMDVTYTNISTSFIGRIPGIAYDIPDLDALVTVNIYPTNSNNSAGCVQLQISNEKTVDETGIRWATAAVAGVGLFTSMFVGSLGHTNAAAHVSVYAFSLFTYFQSVAIIGLCAVPLPPIVQSWTQDFVWSLGIIEVPFLQEFATWYQLATGGTPDTILNTLGTKSVQVLKRSLAPSTLVTKSAQVLKRSLANSNPLRSAALQKRSEVTTTASGEYVVKGIQRVAFRENMEPSNLFFTAVTFYCILIIVTLLFVVLFKKLSELIIRMRWMKSENPLFDAFRNDWHVTLKGIVFRLILIGFPSMTILSLWEFTQVDSPAEVVLAVIFFFGLTTALTLAAFHVTRVAKESEHTHKTAAYLLFADATVLNKWGFLYVPFRASAYYYVIPSLLYVLIKGAFVGLSQKSGVTQAVALLVIEAIALIGASVVRPWMDKSTNGIHISICAVNFINAICLLIFTDIFNGPGLLIGVVGVIFFFLNVAFALVLLLIVLIVAGISVWRKNPDVRYATIKDNRASFMQSHTTIPLTTELDELAATARGSGMKTEYEGWQPAHVNGRKMEHEAWTGWRPSPPGSGLKNEEVESGSGSL